MVPEVVPLPFENRSFRAIRDPLRTGRSARDHAAIDPEAGERRGCVIAEVAVVVLGSLDRAMAERLL